MGPGCGKWETMPKSKRDRRGTSEPLFGPRLFVLTSRVLLALLLVILLLTFIGCEIRKPESPTWTTDLVVPVVNRTYDMAELIDKIDAEGLFLDSNDLVTYEYSAELDSVALDAENLSTPNLQTSFSEMLGTVAIDPPVVAPVTLALNQIGPLSVVTPGPVPPMSFVVINNLPSITEFSQATIASGQLWVAVTNNLGIDCDTAVLTLSSVGGGQIGTAPFASGLPNGATDSVLITLDGSTITNRLMAEIDCYTPGGIILTASDKDISTRVQFGPTLTVSSAVAEVPAQDRTFGTSFSVDETEPIYSAEISGGELQLTISNGTNLASTLTFTVDDIRTPSNQPLTVQQAVAPMSFETIVLPLANHRLRPSDSVIPQAVAVDARVMTSGTAPQQVMITSSDQVSVTADISGLQFASVTGIFGSTEATIDPDTEDLDIPTGFDAITLNEAVLSISIENGVQLGGQVFLTLLGSNGKSFTINEFIDPASGGQSTLTLITDSTVADFLSPLPQTVTYSGWARFGDGVSVGTIHDGDFVLASIDIAAPLAVTINESQVDLDIESEEIDQDDIDIVTDHVVSAALIYDVISHLPIGARVSIRLGGDSATVESAPQLVVGPIEVDAAPTDAIGLTTGVTTSNTGSIALDSTDIRILENDPLYIATELWLHDTNGQVVRLTASNYVTVRARVEVEYRFDGEF